MISLFKSITLFKPLLIFKIYFILVTSQPNQQKYDSLQSHVIPFQPVYLPFVIFYPQMQQHRQRIPLHPIQIKFAPDYSEVGAYHNKYKLAGKLFHIGAFYLSKCIQVENIFPQSQTRLRKKPNYIVIPQTGEKITINVSPHYINEGFNPNETDIIVFGKYRHQNYVNALPTGVLQVQRRPIYGFMFFHFVDSGDQANQYYIFHTSLQEMIHAIVHILGFNLNYILKDVYVNVNNFEIDPNYKTKFFKNPYTNETLNQSQVLRKHENRTQFFLIAKQLREGIFKMQDCQNRGYKLQNMGVALQKTFKNFLLPNGTIEKRQIFDHHFSSLYGFHEQLMQFQNNPQTQYLRPYRVKKHFISLFLYFLNATGFYQKVNINSFTTDSYAVIDSDQQRKYVANFYKQQYDSCSFQKINVDDKFKYCQIINGTEYQKFMCDNYGQIQLLANVPTSDLLPFNTTQGEFIDCQQDFVNCQAQNFNLERCLLQANINFGIKLYKNQYCLSAYCLTIKEELYLKIIISGRQYIRCGPGQKLAYIHQSLTLECPKFMKSFCSVKLCSNACSRKGVCINGNCVVPSKQYNLDNDLQKSSLAKNQIYSFATKQQKKSVCQSGCAICRSTQLITECIFPSIGFGQGLVEFTSSNNIKFRTKFPGRCSYFCSVCQLNIKIIAVSQQDIEYDWQPTCLECNQQFFKFSYQGYNFCSKCVSELCSNCAQGPNMGKQCTNCVQGTYLNSQKVCKACQGLSNCFTCQQNLDKKLSCIKCFTGYHISSYVPSTVSSQYPIVINSCVRCLPNCGKCNQIDIKKCEGCFQGYYLYQPQKGVSQCLRCGPNCLFCKNQKYCQRCDGLLYQIKTIDNQTNTCIKKCNQICLTCQQNNPDNCLSCPQLNYKINNQTKKCQPVLQCNSTSDFCYSCPNNYGLVLYDNPLRSKCQKCSTQKCLSCLFRKCYLCQSGYYLETDNLSCKKCPIQCPICQNSHACIKCEEGYTNKKNIDGTIFSNKCQKCTHNCKTCYGSPHQCVTCLKNYTQIGLTCVSSISFGYYNVQLETIGKKFVQRKLYTQALEDISSQLQIGAISQFTLIDFTIQPLVLKVYIGSNHPQMSQFLQQQFKILEQKYQLVNTSINENPNANRLLQQANITLYNKIQKQCRFAIFLETKLNQTIKHIKIMKNNQTIAVNISMIWNDQQNCSIFKLKQKQTPQPANWLLIGLIIGLSILIIIILTISIPFCLYQIYKRKKAENQLKQATQRINNQNVTSINF